MSKSAADGIRTRAIGLESPDPDHCLAFLSKRKAYGAAKERILALRAFFRKERHLDHSRVPNILVLSVKKQMGMRRKQEVAKNNSQHKFGGNDQSGQGGLCPPLQTWGRRDFHALPPSLETGQTKSARPPRTKFSWEKVANGSAAKKRICARIKTIWPLNSDRRHISFHCFSHKLAGKVPKAVGCQITPRPHSDQLMVSIA